jgi:hypothetical protein
VVKNQEGFVEAYIARAVAHGPSIN